MKKITLLFILGLTANFGFAQNVFTDGTFDDPAAWTVIQQNGNNNATAVIANGVATFDDINAANWGSEGHVAIYKAFTVSQSGFYQFDADVTTNGLNEHWFELFVGTTTPVDGQEYNTNDFGAVNLLALNSWDCGGTTNTYSGSWLATDCKGLDGTIELDAGTTYYALVRTGGINWGTGVILDNFTLVSTATPPNAAFTAATTTSDLEAVFTNNSTSATSYSWDFGDGSGTSNIENPTYTYAFKGQYNVTLTATSSVGTSVSTQEIFIGDVSSPISEFSFDFSLPTPLRNESLLDYSEADGVATATGVNDDWWSQIKYVHNAGIDLSGGDRGISVKVKGPRTSVITIQIETGGTAHVVTANYTTENAWQTLLFDFSSFSSTNNTKIALFFDIQTNFDNTVDPNLNIFQVDDYVFGAYASLGVDDLKISGATVYPNPTTNSWNVSTNNVRIDSIKVFDILGKQVISLQPNTMTSTIDATTLTPGVYVTKIKTELGVETKRLIKH
ncbi:MAG: PKD domain-containing protein [Flavobacteriaceae bacterium]